MAQSSESEQEESMMEEALKILKDEGFSLPNDVIDTLTTASRSNPPLRRKGSLRGHRMCEVQSNTRKQRNVRESSAKRGDRRSCSIDANDEASEGTKCDDNAAGVGAGVHNDVADTPVTPSEGASNATRVEREDVSESSSSCSASTVKENQEMSSTRQMESLPQGQPCLRSQLSRQDSESSIASSASSLNRKLNQVDDRRGSYSSSVDGGYNTSIENAKQVHEARTENLKNINKQIENKISGWNNNNNNGLKREISRDSGFTETGDTQRNTPTSMVSGSEHTAAANNQAEYDNQVNVVGDSSKEFKDTAVSSSDYKEQSLSTDHGEAHVITSTASDLSAAEMTSRSNEVTADGTVVSSASKLADEEGNSALSRITTKVTDNEMAKLEDFESENRRTKSSRNDSISTSATGVTTASSRHASSMDQELNQENSKLSASNDGRNISSSVSAAQQLTRHQEKDNIEQSTDGSSRSEHTKVCDKASLSKSNIEETQLSEDGRVSDSISASQQLEAKSNVVQNEENTTSPDGTRSLRRQDSTTSSFSEKSSSEKKSVQQLPYAGGSSTELTKKEDSSSVSKSSKSFNEIKENSHGRTEKSNTENSNAMSSSFSGKCESVEQLNGSKLHKTSSTENSSENRVKSVTSNVTHSTSGGQCNDVMHSTSVGQRNDNSTPGGHRSDVIHPTYGGQLNDVQHSTLEGQRNDVTQSTLGGQRNDLPGFPRERRLSDASSSSTLSNMSGLSRENIKPPTYEETMSNLSRAHSNSSLYSRQDSSASSIASSAGAFNERQRQKALGNSRSSSFDSNTNVKEVIDSAYSTSRPRGIGRQDSYSSDSTLSGGRDDYTANRRNVNNTYGNNDNGCLYRESGRSENQQSGRVINHPIRQVGQSTYSRSYTDPVPQRVPNRRATIIGDVVVTERDVAEAREEVHAKLRGKDDAYVTRASRADREVETFSARGGSRPFRSGFDSFGREMMNIVDSFFEDDDDFGFGLTSRRRRSQDRDAEPMSPRRLAGQNPYTVREDLSQLSSSRDSSLDHVSASKSPVEYAASDSGYRPSRRESRDSTTKYGRIISDSASDCGGYDRQRPRTSDASRALKTDSYARNNYTDISSASARQKNNNRMSHEYSGATSRFNDSTSAGDNFQSAGKSIPRDKKTNSSILSGDWHSDYVKSSGSSSDYSNRYALHGDRFDSRSLNETYGIRAGSETDMSDAGSTSHSFRSLPPDVNLGSSRGQEVQAGSYRIHNSSDYNARNKRHSGANGTDKVDDNRRQRIDSALSWIRSELGELRTQDKALMTQFQRCQESIEQLKKQRPWYEVFSDDEEEGDERHWEDWEIDDFDRSCQIDRRDNSATVRGNKPGTLFTKEYQRMSIKTTE